jgi:hypothetical protein
MIRSILWSLVYMFLLATVSSAQSLLYFPQIVDGTATGTQWSSALAITNTAAVGTAAASGTLTFTEEDGLPWNIALFDEQQRFVGSGSVSFQLSGGQTKIFLSNGAGPLNQGFATISSNLPVTGTALFFEFSISGTNTNRVSEAGVLPATPLTRQAILTVQDGSVSTAVAVANPGTGSANITFQLLDTNGVSSLASVGRTLSAKNHTAFFVNQLFPNIPSQFFGTLRITSDVPLITTGLVFEKNGQFATLAVFPLQ